MTVSRWLTGGLCVAALTVAGRAPAATITQTTVADFQTGLTTGAVAVLHEPGAPGSGPQPGEVGVLPQPGASILSDDFNYTNQTDFNAAGWHFDTPNAQFYQDLIDNPSSYSFPGNGTLNLHVSRAQDLWGTHVGGQDRPLLVMNDKEITGDFIAETKLTIQGSRANPTRLHGIFVMVPSPDGTGGQFIDGSTNWTSAGTQTLDNIVQQKRYAPDGFGWEINRVSYPSNTMWVRLVRQGAYFSSYFKQTEDGPWVFLQRFSMNPLKSDPSVPVIVGIVEKSWGGGDQYQDTQYDYFKVNEVSAASTGTYSNVIDGKLPGDWQSVSLTTQSMPGTKFQVRSGNTVAAGTITDGGDFTGPDGTGATYYESDVANVLPATFRGKRYLEYKLSLDDVSTGLPGETSHNLPAVVKSVSADYQPAGLTADFVYGKNGFGADTPAVVLQPGDADLALKRTQVFIDNFDADPTTNGWSFNNGAFTGAATLDVAARPGWLRMGIPYPEDIFVGSGNKAGGVRLLRDIPSGTGDFEIEAELNLETQVSRMVGIHLWQDVNNFIGIVAARRDQNTEQIGIVDDYVLNDSSPDINTRDYGTNHVFLRVTKQGQIITLSFRDADSPTWRVHRVFNTAGRATGGTDFMPTQIGFQAKAYGAADQDTKYADINYFKLSTVTATGAKDLTYTIPAGANLDVLVPLAEAPGGLSYQVKKADGTFVGPDGTAGTTFTSDEPKIPASVNGQANLTVRTTFSNTTPAGTPYLHALGVQHGNVVRDTNRTDFEAGATKSGVDLSTRPGAVTPVVNPGTPVKEDFTTAPSGWLFSNNWNGKTTPSSSYSFTNTPGSAELSVATPTDLWGPGGSADKPRVFLYNGTPISGDFQLDTLVNFPSGRDTDRHQGIAIVQANPAGAAPDTNIDLTNIIMFGPYRQDSLRMMRADNNAFADFGADGAYTATTYYLRLVKLGTSFTGYFSTDGTNYTQAATYTMSHDMGNVYIGFLAKSYGASSGEQIVDFDYLTVTPLSTTGAFESRVLELGSADVLPVVLQNGNSGGLKLQFRGADTAGGLAGATYTGPDGTSGTTYDGNFTGALNNLSGKRYVQYKATLPAGTILNDLALVALQASSLPISRADAQTALKIAGGIQTASSADKTRLDVNTDGKVDLLDATQIMRTVNGL